MKCCQTIRRIRLAMIMVLGVTIGCTAQEVNTAKLDSFFNALALHGKMMGGVAVLKSGKVVYRRSLGYSNVGPQQKLAANDTTCYRIGSATKMFTAAMIFQLIDEGKLSLTTPLSTYFPDIPQAGKIPVSLLLNHRSGLYDFVNDYGGRKWLTKPHTAEDIRKVIANGKRHSAPDVVFRYSNSAYFLLAKIMEQITGQSYAANLQQRICIPLGLKHTYAARDNTHRDKAAIPYAFSGGSWNEVVDMWFPNVIGAGDVESTPAELAAFCHGLLSGRLIRPESLQWMTRIGDPPFGMGLMQLPFLQHAGYGHGGDTYGSHTFVAHFPGDSLTVATCIHGETYTRYGINTGFLSICFNEAFSIPDFDRTQIDNEPLAGYTGIYSPEGAGRKMFILLKRKRLYAHLEGRPASRLVAVGPGEFCFKPMAFCIKFKPGKDKILVNFGFGTLLYKKAM